MGGPMGNETLNAPQAEAQSLRDSSRIRQRPCEQCHRWFWAWDTGRTRCFTCDPLPTAELRPALERIARDGL